MQERNLERRKREQSMTPTDKRKRWNLLYIAEPTWVLLSWPLLETCYLEYCHRENLWIHIEIFQWVSERERKKNQGMVYDPKTMLNLCVILHHVILVVPSKLNELSIVAPFQHTHILWKSEKTYHRYPKKKELLTKRLDDHHHAHDSVVVFDTNRVNEQPIATEDQSSQQETFASLKCRLSCLWTIKEWNWNF